MSDTSPPSAKGPLTSRNPARREATDALERVAVALTGLQYGEVRVIVQNGLIVQIERTDTQRLR